MTARRCVDSPLGALTLTAQNGAITGLRWGNGPRDETSLLKAAEEQLAAYFSGELQVFDLPLAPEGSAFQKSVCAEIAAIPYGETRRYGELAKRLGVTPQAVGQGCGGNPLPILIPCHRVLAANGLGGYSGAGGVETKVWLLRHEGAGLLI